MLMVWVGAFAVTAQSLFAPASNARIVYTEGSVSVDGVPAVIGQQVPYGAVVQTGAAARAEIEMGLHNRVLVEASTILRVEVASQVNRMRLDAGRIGAVVEGLARLPESGSRMFIHTRNSVLGVRGTFFYVAAESADSTYVCVCNGELSFQGAFDAFELASRSHEARRFVSTESGAVRIIDAPLLYHDDETIERLAAAAGVSVRWDHE